MGWLTYYNLLVKYNGDLSKATAEEMDFAWRDNPNDPSTARQLAEIKYAQDLKESIKDPEEEMKEMEEAERNLS
jgi:hypothetical protein